MTIVNTTGTLLAGHQHSVFLTDNGVAPNGYLVTILEDQQIVAAQGHSAFRFLNQAAKTGAVDVYMVPAGATMANTIPIVTNLPVGGTAGYISFASQTVTMVVTPTGVTTPQYASTPMTLTGGEVRTVLLIDTQLTSNPAVRIHRSHRRRTHQLVHHNFEDYAEPCAEPPKGPHTVAPGVSLGKRFLSANSAPAGGVRIIP